MDAEVYTHNRFILVWVVTPSEKADRWLRRGFIERALVWDDPLIGINIFAVLDRSKLRWRVGYQPRSVRNCTATNWGIFGGHVCVAFCGWDCVLNSGIKGKVLTELPYWGSL